VAVTVPRCDEGPPPPVRTRAHATRAGAVILCEGYTDTIALHQAGIPNAVGLMGTALTDDQVAELARMVDEAGLIANKEGRYELTPKGIRRIGSNALSDLFRKLTKDVRGYVQKCVDRGEQL